MKNSMEIQSRNNRSLFPRSLCRENYSIIFFGFQCLFLTILLTAQALATTFPATSGSKIGDTVTNPLTGANETVVALIKDNGGQVVDVVTSTGLLLFTRNTVGDQFQAADPANPTVFNTYQVVAVTLNATTGLVESVDYNLVADVGANPAVTPITQSTVDDQSATYNTIPPGVTGAPPGTDFNPIPNGSGPIKENHKGSRGRGGSDAYGVSVCLPDWLGGGCDTIGKKGSKGKNGGTGPTVNRTIGTTHGGITTTSATQDGIEVTSAGGNGGTGGDSYGNISAYRGGNGGNGGKITLVNGTTVKTAGSKAHGIEVVSRSGKGGRGGDGILFAASGSGGNARSGGQVSITNNNSIETGGNNAHGIYGLSVGGTGGSGGGGWGIVGKGGSGAAGGSGGKVSIINNALIHTKGRGSHGILGQSIGGTGGNGGDAGGIVAFGGGSSTGGAASNVTITQQSNGNIVTDGTYAIGIFGQSIGGSGGDGGAAGGIVSFGAKAGSGNSAGRINITTDAGSHITTNGDYSVGIFGQSVGGGGGSAAPTGGVVSMGGRGGSGGNGSTVSITNGAVINTSGKYSFGLFGQSIGGGGGSAVGTGGLVALGGSGSAGGSAGNVTLTNTTAGVVHTRGESGHAVFAQSIGGGGGSGAAAGGLVALGGKGSSGGSSATVTVTNNGALITEGKDARGIFAQSIGGGGGSGGGTGGVFALGGGSSTGSNGGQVNVTNKGNIATSLTGSDAIFAQSIGGGGGSGASSGGLVALGGSGSGGGNGNRVTITNSGFLSTGGRLARGIFAQSIGGGGGSGGTNGGLVSIGGSAGGGSNASDVTIKNTGKINTKGDWATGVFAQSIGGGGGSGGNSDGVLLTIGGKGGSGGNAGNVSVNHGGIITTQGSDASGVFAQAVGGGGGNGGSSNSGSVFAGVAIGGSGGAGGNGADVTIALDKFNLSGNLLASSILTKGDRSSGVLAQSIGGGGGNGGSAIQATAGTFGSVSVALGGAGSSGGKGGSVHLNGNGNVTTFGNNATGVNLQSVGGGGGNGGLSVAASLQVGIGGAGLGVALGGSSGSGGAGGVVSSDYSGAIKTSGAFSSGLVAQSVGGGGGNGGTAISAVGSIGATGSGAIGVGIGGSGGNGGSGGKVDTTLNGSIETGGDQSTAILVQSIGGGGGNGGMTVAAVGSAAGVGSGAISVGVGGTGGTGGTGGETKATIGADVTTTGDGSSGIVTQTIGGGGGNGGLTVSASASGAGIGGGAISIGVGGTGGTGGEGGIVNTDYNGSLETKGDNAVGLLAQSVGGGGGNGGGSIAASLSGAGGGSGTVSVNLGGAGGSANDGGKAGVNTAVTLKTTGTATTQGDNSAAIVAQSIGGGGGNGGYSITANGSGAGAGSGAITVGLGGSGAGGGNGKDVVAIITSTILTSGTSSTGFLAQSVGGGGGNGGFNVSGSLSGAGAGSGAVAIGLGGKGDSGGTGGLVTASSSGVITTVGTGAAGFLTQSIGGGGGNGGFNVSGSASGGGIGSGGVSIGLGGSGGGAGTGGEVNVTSSGNVTTNGNDATAIMAQSVGGGGGNGNYNVSASASGAGVGSGAVTVGLGGTGGTGGKGGKVGLTVTNDVNTAGRNSSGVVAQSIGGGGGNGGYNVAGAVSGAGVGSGAVSVGLGGAGGSGGDSNVVISAYTGNIITKGNHSTGLLAQSIGGGGGNGAGDIAATLSGSSTGSGAISVGLGGKGGVAGNGGKTGVDRAVTLTAGGHVTTHGDSSAGIVAQSIGGGGGNGGYNISADGSVSGVGSGAVAVGLGGQGAGGGAGKEISAIVTSIIQTSGSNSTGFLVQSIGGGGGNGGFNVSGSLSASGTGSGSVSLGLGGSGAGGANAGNVIATSKGSITTTGKNSSGLVIQSIGGGGGNGAFDVSGSASGAGVGSGTINVGLGGSGGGGATGGAVTVFSSGDVSTTGKNSTGILAQSIGGGGGNGDFNVSGAISGAATGSGGISAGLGGSAGSGGMGGAVNLTVKNNVTTSKQNSSAVIAQSIGGGGGTGTFNISGAISGSGAGSGAASVGLGGTGGGGGDGGQVLSDLDGHFKTSGLNSTGVLIQSIGGGGGNGGFKISGSPTGAGTGSGSTSEGFGGAGGNGGIGGIITSVLNGFVTTGADNSSAIVAQSIGGGGGNGSMAIAGTIAGGGTGSGAASIGTGGSGGRGGNSSAVSNTVTATVKTSGHASTGVLAQSVGGGGGNGAIATSGTITMAGTGSGGASAGVGGTGGDGGLSAAVTNHVEGSVTTTGSDSAGIIAQSIGGGGGTGAMTIAGTFTGGGTGSGATSVSVGGTGGGGGDSAAVNNTVVKATVKTDGDRSIAVLAQSVGGGGGNGGMTIAGTITAAGTGTGAASVGVGGSGGAGGNAAAVTNKVEGSISTKGNNATAVVAQSVGGGGGNGGLSTANTVAASGKGAAGASVAIGGVGGGGGDADTVDNNVNATIVTLGDNANGVLAQSVGGGGGNGGMSIAGTVTAAGTGSGSASVGVGGSGGDGGNAATVTNAVKGSVKTGGNGAIGIIAQSIGGGGGNGGIGISGAISGSGSNGGAVAVGVGGSGGLGGNSAKVINTVDGHVFTKGKNASGIVAQSIGGGGGNGGLTVSGAVSVAKSGSGAVSVGVGGTGGDGGFSADVVNTVMNGFVQTQGKNSTGILTQSIGGGGGNGGISVNHSISGSKAGSGALAVAVGGIGGGGGNAGNAISKVTGGVVTTENNSIAILTQSIGGSGGNGGISTASSLNMSKENGGSLAVGVGGFGGDGGDAGSVSSTVNTTVANNQIGTKGQDSTAIIAQSVGGGGGNGGINVSDSINLASKNGAAIGVGVGGFGGGGGNAGNVNLAVTGNVVTEGNNSHGLVAQSIGGGGGNGGTNVSGTLNVSKTGTGGSVAIGVGGFGGLGGNAGNVAVNYKGTISAQPRTFVPQTTDSTGAVIPAHYETKSGDGSDGILAQSIGGGGGNGGTNVSGALSFASSKNGGNGHALVIGVGGFGGSGGTAGAVNVTVSGGNTITASGNARSAIIAQSVGGGGGNGATNISGGIVTDAPIILGTGGLGGDGGTADKVTVVDTTNIITKGERSYGILAQSVGGGGGNGGLNVSGSLTYNKEANIPAVTIGIGGFGGAGNISNDVSVTHNGTITTEGKSAHGIYAQSVAGGGGDGGYNFSLGLALADSKNSGGNKDVSFVTGIGGHGGTGADAGNVDVKSLGTITTKGDFARGIFAQSVGGGGGNGGFNFSGNFAQNSSLITAGVGGFGSGGGNAGKVTVDRGSVTMPTGTIITTGLHAHGIEASSIGGGGGDAGMNMVIGFSLAGKDTSSGSGSSSSPPKHPQHTGIDPSVFTNYDQVLAELKGRNQPDSASAGDTGKSAFAVQIAIGGAGGGAGNGNLVTVDNIGDVVTRAAQSYGLLAQSIGGGGGNAYINIAGTYIDKGKRNKGFNLALGGATGNGGNGAKVNVDQKGSIETFGRDSYGILAQSVGGGGGNAGLDFIYTKASGGKIGISLGRQGGSGGFGDTVTLNAEGGVKTHGDGAYALLAQSIGNGGGNSSSRSISIEKASPDDTSPARSATVSIGIKGGQGGSAGNVILAAKDRLSTDGDNAAAIFAQSVGGGGGNGGSATGFGISSESANLVMGGSGGLGGSGGTIDITSFAQVHTKGRNSIGIFGQSVGGGGGTGGMARDILLSGAGTGAVLSMGGRGGTGSVAGKVTIENKGIIVTAGDDAYGILGQSLGGGGGNGGMTINTLRNKSTDKGTQLAVAIGGNGGDGATGGNVQVTNRGSIGTSGRGAIGVFAQSIGGGGGNAKQVVTASLSSKGAGNKISLGIGGQGGTGGQGGNVDVKNLRNIDGTAGEIITAQTNSHGIFAMSVGGGGGTGSTVVTANASTKVGEENPANSLAFSLGGAGGTGGKGGKVTVTNNIGVTTYGTESHGIIAQSIGGGGGNGGVSLSGNMVLGNGDTASHSIAVAIGGKGGNGNASGDVSVINNGNIEVFGKGSDGVFAQSIGGGGGNGAFAMALSSNLLTNPRKNPLPLLTNFALGGAGGAGANSANVVVNNNGSIITHGDNTYGIFAQSVGGGGGAVGFSISSPVWMATNMLVPVVLGSRDGTSGTAGNVTVNTKGTIQVLGNNSHAYLAQSVNGGGGNVDMFLDVSKTAQKKGTGSVINPVTNGSPQGGGAKELAFVSNTLKLGAIKAGIGAAGDFVTKHLGDLIALGENSSASSTQSVGGGGGNANENVVINKDAQIKLDLLLGSEGTNDGNGGNINSDRTGNVSTSGDTSKGTSVQSIGGGGGELTVAVKRVPDSTGAGSTATGGAVTALSIVSPVRTSRFVHSKLTVSDYNSLYGLALPGSQTIDDSNASTVLAMGANGGLNNSAGSINNTYRGNTQTTGDRSLGMLIQSIGGGGGDTRISGVGTLSVNFGGANGATGDGGNINISNNGDILTTGALSHGIVLQSIGGGGGTVFTDLSAQNIGIATHADNSGNGGNITFDQTGNITATGDNSIALLAQSLGGGGGALDRLFINSAGGHGTSADIHLNVNGNMVSSGANGIAVFAQSVAADGEGNIIINLPQGKQMVGGTGGAALVMSGGVDNKFISHGSVMTKDMVSGMAIYATSGNDQVDNYKILDGQVYLGEGNNSFVNHEQAVFVPGRVVYLGAAGNMLVNNGTMATGDTDLAQDTELSGSFTQSINAKDLIELDFGTDKVDNIAATGTVSLAGKLTLSLLNPQNVLAGNFSKVVFSGKQGVIDNGIALSTFKSRVFTTELQYPDANQATLNYNVDFSPAGMGLNLLRVGDYFNRVQNAGSSPVLADVVKHLLYIPDDKSYRNALSQLSPDFYGEQQLKLINDSDKFLQSLLSCHEANGKYRFTREGSCFWSSYQAENISHDAYDDYKGSRFTTDAFSIGLQKTFSTGWSTGIAISQAHSNGQGYSDRWHSKGDTNQFALALKYRAKGTKLAAVVSIGQSDTNTLRQGNLVNAFSTHINRRLNTVGGLLRLSHDIENNTGYLFSYVDFGVTQIKAKRATETGAGALNLILPANNETHRFLRPGVETGMEGMLSDNTKLRFFMNFSLQHKLSASNTTVLAGFQAAPSMADYMQVPVDIGQNLFNVNFGVDLITRKNLSISLEHNRMIDNHISIYSTELRLSLPF